MSLRTHSKIYYGFEVSAENQYLDFNEGGGDLAAQVAVGSYTLEQFAAAIEVAMNAVGTNTYEVTVNRTTRFLTIAADGDFDLLVTTGDHAGTSIFGTAGFTVDKSGGDEYEADEAIGTAYSTQFIPQSYVGPDDSRASTYGTVNKSASGKIEVVSFGSEAFVEFELKWVNNYEQGAGGPIRDNPTGVQELRALMQFLITKAPFEFMPDEDDADTFITMFLESTDQDSNGLKYKLKEQYGKGLPEYFDTGILKFRVLED